MLHLAAYTAAIGNTANTDVAALADDFLTGIGNHFQLRRPANLYAAWAGSPTLNRVRIDSPSVRLIGNPYIRPIDQSVTPTSPHVLHEMLAAPFRLPAGEEIAIQATSDIAMGTERFTALIWIGDNLQPAPRGNVQYVRFTSTTAATANTWTSLSITLDGALPPGEYSVVDSIVFSANAIAHRWIFPDQPWRPGALSITDLEHKPSEVFRQFKFGEFGRFFNTSLPICQVLCNGADASHTGWLGIIRTKDTAPVV